MIKVNTERTKIWEDTDGCQRILWQYQAYCKSLDEFFTKLKPFGIVLSPESLKDFHNRGNTALLDMAQQFYQASLETVPVMLHKSTPPFDVLAFSRVYTNHYNSLLYLRDRYRIDPFFVTVDKTGHCVLTPEAAKKINERFECYLETDRQKEAYDLTQSIKQEYTRLVEIVTDCGYSPDNFLINGGFGLIVWDNAGELDFNLNLLNDLK